jgi:hypothetical protein
MKKILMLCAVLAFAVRASGQTPYTYTTDTEGQPPLPTTQSKLPNTLSPVAVTWTYDAQQEMLNLRLTNNSGKDITAYSMTVSRRYSNRSTGYTDGSPTVSEMMEEAGFIYSQDRERPNGVFAAGTSRNQHIPEAKDITDVNAVVDMAVFADATAYVQNERAFKQLMAIRKGQLMAMQKVDEVLKRAVTEPSPVAAALAELTPLLVDALGKNRSPENPEDNQQSELQTDVQNLRSMQQAKINEREYLTRYAGELEKRIELMKPHCEIVVNQ